MTKKLNKLKKKINIKVDFLKRTKNNINLLTKPTSGGIPAKDINKITMYIDIDFNVPINLKSLKVFKYLKSNKKKIENILNNNIT